MFWGQTSKLAEVAFTLAIGVLAVRFLHANRFGTYSVLTYAAGAASFLLPMIGTESVAAVLPRFTDQRQRLFILILLALLRIGLIAGVIIVVLVFWSSIRVALGLGLVTPLLVLTAGAYWLTQDLGNTLYGFYLSELNLRPVAVVKTIGQVATLSTLFGLVVSGVVSVGSVMLAVAGGFLITDLVLGALLRSHWPPRRVELQSIRFVLGFTPRVWVLSVLGFTLMTQIDVLMISAITHKQVQAGYYAAAVGVVARAQYTFLAGWSGVFVPALGAARMEGGESRFREGWRLLSKFWLLVALPMNVFTLALAHPIVAVLFGPDYKAAGGLLVWMSAFGVLTTLVGGTLGINALWPVDRQDTLVRVRVLTAPLNFGLAVPLIMGYGALGAVIATGVAAVATAAGELLMAQRQTGVRYPARTAAKLALAAGLAAVPAVLIPVHGAADLVAVGLIFVVVYALALWVLAPLRRGDIDALRRVSPGLGRLPLDRLVRESAQAT